MHSQQNIKVIKMVVAFCNVAREPKMNPSRILPFESGFFADYADALKGNNKIFMDHNLKYNCRILSHKYMSTIPYPKLLGPRMFRNS
jgi:hypothetical protein